MWIVEIDNAEFIENGEISGSLERQSVESNKVRLNISLPINVQTFIPITNVVTLIEEHFNNIEQYLNEILQEITNSQVFDANEPQTASLRKSQKERKSVI